MATAPNSAPRMSQEATLERVSDGLDVSARRPSRFLSPKLPPLRSACRARAERVPSVRYGAASAPVAMSRMPASHRRMRRCRVGRLCRHVCAERAERAITQHISDFAINLAKSLMPTFPSC